MRCQYCGYLDSRVIDSRPHGGGAAPSADAANACAAAGASPPMEKIEPRL